jgi:glycine/sarcosine N-methyltransferase
LSGIKGRFAKSYDKFVKRACSLPEGLGQLVESYHPRNIVEFGCGTGRVATGLSLQGYDVTGVDISRDMLREARKKAAGLNNKPNFIQADIININLQYKFDLLLCLGNTVPLIFRLPDARKLFRNFARHLRPGGTLVIQQLNYDKILREKPRTFAIDTVENHLRIKQYNYKRNLVNFTVTIVDHSHVPPKIARTYSRLRPWKKADLIEELKKVGFGGISAYGDYSKKRFSGKSKDLIVVGKLKPAGS